MSAVPATTTPSSSTSTALTNKGLREYVSSIRVIIDSVSVVNNSNSEPKASIDGANAHAGTSPSPSSPSTCRVLYPILILCELATRGVDVRRHLRRYSTLAIASASSAAADVDEGANDDVEWTSSLLAVVRDVAGRLQTKRDDDGGAAPLFAALYAAAGDAACACRDAVPTATTENSSSSSPLPPPRLPLLPGGDDASVISKLDATMSRCMEVNDGRMYALLGMARDVASSVSHASGGIIASANDDMTMTSLRRRLNELSYSHRLHCASEYSSVLGNRRAVAWKRCLDSAIFVEGGGTICGNDYNSYRNPMAVPPLYNMLDIAVKRGNDMRVRELGPYLALGYLGILDTRLRDEMDGCRSSTSTNKGGDVDEWASDVDDAMRVHYLRRCSSYAEFIDASTTTTDALLGMARKAASLALDATTTTTTTASDATASSHPTGTHDDSVSRQLLPHYVISEIRRVEEGMKVWTEARRRRVVMMNRRPESSSSSSSSRSSAAIAASAAGTAVVPVASAGALEREVRSEILFDAFDAAYDSIVEVLPSDDGRHNEDGCDNRAHLLLEALSPSSTALRDAIIVAYSSSASDAAATAIPTLTSSSSACRYRRYAASSDIVRDCHVSLALEVERLMDIASVVSSLSARRRLSPRAERRRRIDGGGSIAGTATVSSKEEGDCDAFHGIISFLWRAVISYVTPLMTDYLHNLVVGGGMLTGGVDANDGHVGGAIDDRARSNGVALRRLAESCSMTIIAACWICDPYFANAIAVAPSSILGVSSNAGNDAGDGDARAFEFDDKDYIMAPLLSTANSCLLACQWDRVSEERRNEEEKHSKRNPNDAFLPVLSSREKYTDSEKQEVANFRCALASSTCRMELIRAVDIGGSEDLSSSLSENRVMDSLIEAARKATIAATVTKDSNDLTSSKLASSSAAPPTPSSPSANAKFGAHYVQFLSAWLGMFHQPWPFCTVDQARTITRNARESVSAARKHWSRRGSGVEQLMLDVGEADLEGCLRGGSTILSQELYRVSLCKLEGTLGNGNTTTDGHNMIVKRTLRVHCLLGLARLSISKNDPGDAVAAEEFSRDALDILLSLECSRLDERSQINVFLGMSRAYHICVSRQLIADACIRSSRPEDAGSFLAEAVKDFPGNFEASFALAAFHLRAAIGKTETSQIKKATAMLLKAAKLDPTKSGPFSLLGTCYELLKDISRSKGCYKKALSIEPSHPVAGRGLLRLTRLDDAQSICENAAKRNSPANGWAWRAMGQLKSMGGGDFVVAAICFQQALRCRDIQAPENDMLGVFFANPASPAVNIAHCEASETWVELAACYRQLGKYSAALRAFEEAFILSGGVFPPYALCAWAQIHLDLGLYEKAADKCAMILSADASLNFRRMAAYIEGESCLFLARSCIQEGKFGSSLAQLEKGIVRIETIGVNSAKSHYCEVKLLGDLYSSGSSLPSYVFDSHSTDEQHQDINGRLRNEVQCQLLFLMKGEHAYTRSIELAKEENDEEDRGNNYLVAAAAIDLATNLLSQAMVLLRALGEGSGRGGDGNASSYVDEKRRQFNDIIARSVNAYLFAVDISPHEASAWCGLGCALVTVDPAMSQHAFCRALQIDPSVADSWSNVGLMYASNDAEKCSEILDHLAQLDDTPLMWIGRGLLFEKASREWKRQEVARGSCFTKAADAYRAALQISQHPAALLGLSLTCRRANGKSNDLVYTDLADEATRFESRVSIIIHQNMTGEGNVGACYVSGLTQIEEGLRACKNKDNAMSATLVAHAKKSLESALIRSEDVVASLRHDEPKVVQCDIDLSVDVLSRPQKTEEFPYDMIKNAINFELAPSSNQCLGNIIDRNSSNRIEEARNRVLLNPDSGEAWLIFAHLLAQEATAEYSCTRSLASAKIVAKRAYEMLHERVVNATLMASQRQDHQGLSSEPFEKNALSSLPPAALLSQSMALLSWLEENATQESGGNPCNVDGIISSLQESLMLDPFNSLAAAKLSQFK